MNTESKVLLGIAAAALAGVAIGMLVAPSSGEETRSKIRKQTNKLTNRMIDALETGKSVFSENVDAVTNKVKSAYNEAKGSVNSDINRAKKQVEDMA